MARLHADEIVAVEMYRERDKKFSNRVNSIFQRIGRAHGMKIRNVRGWLAAQTGRADLADLAGQPVLVPWGTGPRDMNGAEFRAYWEDARSVIIAKILPTLPPAERDEIRQMIEAVY